MKRTIRLRRAAIRGAYVGLRMYWFIFRPQLNGVKCILTHGDEVLLVRHTYGSRAWDLPGGGIKRGEKPVETARRETREELGRSIEDWVNRGELSIRNRRRRDNLRTHLFQARVEDRRVEIDEIELAAAGWFPRQDLPPDIGRYVLPILTRVSADSR